MTNENIKKTIVELEKSIKQIANKKNKLFFFVPDSKGTPIGSLSYIYTLAYRLKEFGYNVQILYAEKDFIGVRDWLGDKYADLPHYNATQDILDVSPCDVLFIPELYSSVMTQTKKLHCKKVAILENFDYMTELIPFGASWETMGIYECITTTETLKQRLLKVFPKIKVHVVRPVIDTNIFKEYFNNKKLIVNIITKDDKMVNKIVKVFKWEYPGYGFVTFRYINNKSKEVFAKTISEGEISIWVDTDTDFGYSALEAMACGNIVIGKIPENEPDWMMDENKNLKDNGVWFYKISELPALLAGVLKCLLHEEIPSTIKNETTKTISEYTQEKQDEDIKRSIINEIIDGRKKELVIFKETFENNLKDKEEKQ